MNSNGYPLNNTNYNWERRNKKITGNQLIDAVSAMSEEDKAALREALGVGGGDDTAGKILIVSSNSIGVERLSDEQITAIGVDIDTFMAGKYIAMKIIYENEELVVYSLDLMSSGSGGIRATFGEMALGKTSNGWYLYSTA